METISFDMPSLYRYLLLVCLSSFAGPLSSGAQERVMENKSLAELENLLVADSRNPETLRTLCTEYTHRLDFSKVIKHGKKLAEISAEYGDEDMSMVAHAFIGQSYMALNEHDSALYYINKGMEVAQGLDEETANHWPLIVFYNALGVYSLSVEMDYRKALTLFHNGLEISEKHDDQKAYTVIAGNLVRTYFLRNDPSGLPFALQVYEYGIRNRDRQAMFDGSYVCALMYYLITDYAEAEKYIQTALENVNPDNKPAEVYVLYANVLAALGDDENAELYYGLALEYMADVDFTAATNIYLSYGRYLVTKGRHTEALEYLYKGLELSNEKNIAVYRYLIYKYLSQAYSAMNDHRRALNYFVNYHIESDSIFNVERESSINELRIKYETEKVQKELQESRIVMLRNERNLQALIFIVAITFTILGATYILFRRKNKLYVRIVRQNQEYVKKEIRLEAKIEELKRTVDSKSAAVEKYSVSSLTEEKSKLLFSELEELMNEAHVYREKYLTKERVAEMLNSNRTYLSQVINEHTGLSFNHYVNSYRIEEARRILSDPRRDVALKALASELGFNSMTTFYKLFQNEVGMPPSKFRKKVIELSKK